MDLKQTLYQKRIILKNQTVNLNANEYFCHNDRVLPEMRNNYGYIAGAIWLLNHSTNKTNYNILC